MHRLALFISLLFFAASIRGQETVAARMAQATNHLKRVAAQLSEECLKDIASLEDWQKKRGEVRKQLLEMLGLAPLPETTPLKPKITGTLDRERYRIEKIVFDSMPGLYVTGNFYIPRGATTPIPTILYLCGHAPHPLGAKFNYQDRAAWFAANGYACLILDTLEFGEVPGIHHGLHDLNMWHWLSLGYTPAGTEVWNAMRAIDYLETRPEVDAKRIGVTGISGGGAITWYTAAVDERVSVAAPVCSTYTFGTQAQHWRAWGQCDCIYFHNAHLVDFPIVAALIAPRPLLIISGRKDDDFPPDGYHAVYERGRKIYNLYGAAEKIREFDDEVGHSDPPQFLRESRQWMQVWLKNDRSALPLETNAIPRERAEDLAVLTELPRDTINDRIHETLTTAQSIPTTETILSDLRRSQVRSRLNEKVFRWFPQASIPFETHTTRNDGGWAKHYADYKEVTFQTEPGVRIRAQLLTPKKADKETPILIYVKRPGDSIYFMDLDELLPVLGKQTVLILNARFTEGSLTPDQYRDVQMTAAWCGRTIGAMQIWDTRRALEWIFAEQSLNPASVSIYAKGDMGIIALHAALMDQRVSRVILNDAPTTYRQGPALLNILRITDIPEIVGLFSPREIVSLTPLPNTFDISRRLYRMQNASSKLREAGSLAEALGLVNARPK